MRRPHRPSLTRVNTLLLVLIVLVNGYVIGAPFVPALVYRWQDHGGKRQELTKAIHTKTPQTAGTPKPAVNQTNHVVIPSMLLDEPILDGPSSQQYKILDKGIWRYSNGSTPDKGGNTVLIGHRFTYTNPRGVFYHLDKVHVGDEIGLWWNAKQYTYKVSSVREVEPTETSIEDPTDDARLTLFTCAPLWLPKHRLMVVANLQTEVNQ